MAYQIVFKRYEMKYLLTQKEAEEVLGRMAPYMALDKYGKTTIRNLYLDTPTYRLIRRSREKPEYKEKLRIRSYGPVTGDDTAFVEIKKKYRKVVYKRRLPLGIEEIMTSFEHNVPLPVNSQIGNEIAYFRSYYGELKPKVFLAYEREAYYPKDGSDFRATFDTNIRYRTDDLTLSGNTEGTYILPDDCVLMELKSPGGIPLWMVTILTDMKLYKTPFSKYGTAFEQMFLEQKETGHVFGEIVFGHL